MVVADATVWIDYLRGVVSPQTEWLHREVTRQPIGVPDLILCEVLQGINNARMFARTKRLLLEMEVFDTGGAEMAIASAQNYQLLRVRGFTIRKTIDCILATFCIEHGHALLHNDRDFDPFEKFLGLKVIHPYQVLPPIQ